MFTPDARDGVVAGVGGDIHRDRILLQSSEEVAQRIDLAAVLPHDNSGDSLAYRAKRIGMLTHAFVDLAESLVGVAVSVDKTGSDGQAMGLDDGFFTLRLEVTQVFDLATPDPNTAPHRLGARAVKNQRIPDQER
jgi:hypothetical protein